MAKRDLTEELVALGDAKKALDQAHADLVSGISTTESVTRVAVAKVKDALSDYTSAVPRYQKAPKAATSNTSTVTARAPKPQGQS